MNILSAPDTEEARQATLATINRLRDAVERSWHNPFAPAPPAYEPSMTFQQNGKPGPSAFADGLRIDVDVANDADCFTSMCVKTKEEYNAVLAGLDMSDYEMNLIDEIEITNGVTTSQDELLILSQLYVNIEVLTITLNLNNDRTTSEYRLPPRLDTLTVHLIGPNNAVQTRNARSWFRTIGDCRTIESLNIKAHRFSDKDLAERGGLCGELIHNTHLKKLSVEYGLDRNNKPTPPGRTFIDLSKVGELVNLHSLRLAENVTTSTNLPKTELSKLGYTKIDTLEADDEFESQTDILYRQPRQVQTPASLLRLNQPNDDMEQ